MHIIKLVSIELFRKKRCTIILFANLLGCAIYCIWQGHLFTIHNDPLWVLHKCQFPASIFFLCQSVVSYEIVHDFIDCKIEESLMVVSWGKTKLIAGPVIVLLGYVGVFWMTMGIVPIVSGLSGKMPLEYFIHILQVNSLNYLITGLFATLLGILFGLLLKRIIAYALIAAMMFIMLPASDLIPGILNDSYSINIWPFKTIFSWIFPLNTSWTIDYQYGLSCEGLRWNLVFCWIFFILSLISVIIIPKKAKTKIVAIFLCIILSVTNFILFSRGGSIIDLSLSPTSVFRTDQMYYRNNFPKEEEPSFAVTRYDMDFEITRTLHGKVSMRIDNPIISNDLIFTLYRNYHILRITDETGKELPFSQTGDYFVVDVSDEMIQNITVEYEGFSPVFYSNDQGVCLPGCFPFYPWPGYRKIYYTEPGDSIGYSCYIARNDLTESQFNVRIKGVKNLVVNLDFNGNSFNGTANGVTIMGGFLRPAKLGPYKVINATISDPNYRFSEEWLCKLQKAISEEETIRKVENHINLSEYILYQMNETMNNRAGYGPVIVMSNHMFLQPNWNVVSMAKDIVSQINDPIILSSEGMIEQMKREAGT